MDEVNTKPKLSSIRTYAEDLVKTKEKGTTVKSDTSLNVTSKTEPERETSLPPKTFTRTKNTTPVLANNKSTQAAINDLVKAETSTPVKNTVPSGIETPVASFLAENEDSAPATIITDTKKDRFKLIPSMIDSIKAWWGGIKREQARKKAPRYTVAETSRRRGVIQKATSNTGKAASADFASIQERIRRRKLAEENKPTTTWSANTETGFLLLEAPEETKAPVLQNVKVIPKKSIKVSETPKLLNSRVAALYDELPKGPSGFEDPDYLAKISDEKPVADIVTETETTPVATAKTPEKETTAETTLTETPAPTTAVPEVVEEEIPESREVVVTKNEVSEKNNDPKSLLLSLNTNSVALGVSVITVVISLLSFIIYSNLNQGQPTTVEREIIQAFTESQVSEANLGELSTTDLKTKINVIRNDTTRVTEIAIKINGNELDPATTINLLSKNLPADFAHSLTLARLGFSSEQVPFIVLGITDKATARGGLLLAEPSLYQDFTGAFGTNLAIPSNTKFIDGNLSGVDVRVLKNSSGEEILLYAIIENSVIITTDSLTLAALIPIINN